MKRICVALFFSVFILACGDDVSYITETNVSETISKLDADKDFEECSSKNFGSLVYAEDSSAIFFCNGKSWEKMTMSFDKDTVVRVDSVYVVSVDSLLVLEKAFGCYLEESAAENIYMLICSEDTVYLDKKESLKNLMKEPPVLDSFVDTRDETTYKIIKLGTQTWMAENLNYEDESLEDSLGGSSWCYENKTENCEQYGRLYTWNLANEVCPSGWRLPNDSDWKELVTYVENQFYLTKSEDVVPYLVSSDSWKNLTSTNDIGFSALPAGTKKYSDNSFYGLLEETNYWSSSEEGSCFMIKTNSLVIQQHSAKYGFSVRCLKD